MSWSLQTPQCSTGSRGLPALSLFLPFPGTGHLMDDDRPLFITFKPCGEDNTARAKPAPSTTPIHPQGTEQPPGHHNRHGRVGHGAVRVDTSPAHPPSTHTALRGCVLTGSPVQGAEHPWHTSPSELPVLSSSLQVPPGPWSPPAAQPLPEEDPWPERVALRAQTRLWFEQTQAQRLGPKGELPVWFHGFISRR